MIADCIECMASSDNVIRAGLTPKFKDVATLCSMLNYEGEEGKLKLFEATKEDFYSELYQPPIPDFAVAKIQVRSTFVAIININNIPHRFQLKLRRTR